MTNPPASSIILDMTKRRKSNTQSAKYMRSYTAYRRLAEKAYRNGQTRQADRYNEKAWAQHAKARRAREREQRAAEFQASSGPAHHDGYRGFNWS